MNLGYAALFYMHEQGMEYGPLMSVVYDQNLKEEDIPKLLDTAVMITGIDEKCIRYGRHSYIIVDLNKLHHQIALDVVDSDLKYNLERIAPELYIYAKRGCTGNGGTMIRKTYGWDQQDINRKLWKEFNS